MRFWRENKRLMVGLGAAFFVLLIFWPSIIGNPQASSESGGWKRFFGEPMIARFWRKKNQEFIGMSNTLYEKLTEEKGLYSPKGEKVATLHGKTRRANGDLGVYSGMLKKRMLVVPPSPYRLRPSETMHDLYWWKRLTSDRVYLSKYGSLREVKTDYDLGWGFKGDMLGVSRDDVKLWLRQLYFVRELVKLAVDSRVASVKDIQALPPREAGTKDYGDFIREYPVKVDLTTDLEPLMKFVTGLNGQHGRIIEINPHRQERSNSDGPGSRFVTIAKVQIEAGSPKAIQKGDWLIVRRVAPTAEAEKAKVKRNIEASMEYLGLAIVEECDGSDVLTVRIEPDSLAIDEDGAEVEIRADKVIETADGETARALRDDEKGDRVSTRFFVLNKMEITTGKPQLLFDKKGNPEKIIPPKLEVSLEVSAISFIDPEAGKSKGKKGKKRYGTTKQRPLKRRTFRSY